MADPKATNEPVDITVNGKAIPVSTRIQLESMNAHALRQRALDIRGAMGLALTVPRHRETLCEWVLAVQATLLESAGPFQRQPVPTFSSEFKSRCDREYQRRGGPGRPCAYFVEWFRAEYQRLGGGSGPSLRLEPGQATELEQQAREQLGQRGPAGFAFRPTPRAADTVSEAGSARTEVSSYAESRAAAQRAKLRARGAGNLLTGGEAPAAAPPAEPPLPPGPLLPAPPVPVLGDTPLEDAPGYEIFVKTLAGKTLALRVAGTDTVRGLKQRLGKELNLAAERMKLLQGGAFRTEAYSDPTAFETSCWRQWNHDTRATILDDEETLSGVPKGATLRLVMKLT